MLVVVVHTSGISGEQVPWTGRRHDDDGPESTGRPTADGLFEAVFHALHDGEQVAIGFDCPLTVPADGAEAPDAAAAVRVAQSVDAGPGIEQLRHLVAELGQWRPWTIVTTSLPRWRATTSVLLWETSLPPAGGSDASAAIDAFYAMIRSGDQPVADGAQAPLVNLAAVAAVESEVTADAAELTRPVLRVPVDTGLDTGLVTAG